MKPTILFTLSFLLFSFTTYFPLTIAEQVLDIEGNPIFPGGKFYIMPSIFGPTGGGVRLGKTGNSKCPVTVIQDISEVVKGIPVKFEVAEISPGPGMISTGTHLEIVFVEKPDCVESSKWVVVKNFVPKGLSSIGIGGLEDHPQAYEIDEGTFSIQKHGFGYKLVFCPLWEAPRCYDIGRYPGENGRRLILADGDPYEVVFENADR